VGTSVELICRATVDKAVVDTDISASFTFSHFDQLGSSSTQLNASTFQGVARLSVLLPRNDGVAYRCNSSLSSTDPLVLTVDNTAEDYTLEVKGKCPWDNS